MNKFTIGLNNLSIEIFIDKYKIFYGNNYFLKFDIFQKFRQYFQKKSISDYEENISKSFLKYNDNLIDYRRWEFYEIENNYDLDSDLKLATKNLLYKYIESRLENIEFVDETNTVNIIINDYLESIIAEIISISSIDLKIKNLEFNRRVIMKLLEVYFLKDEFEITKFDLSYDNLVKYQIELINFLAQNNKDKSYIVLFDSTYIDDNIINLINNSESNIYFFIITNNKIITNEPQNFILFNRKIIDLADENYLYNEIIMDLPYILNIDELKELFVDIIAKKNNDKLSEIIKKI